MTNRNRSIWTLILTGATKERLEWAKWSTEQMRSQQRIKNVDIRVLILNEHPHSKVLSETEPHYREIRIDRSLPHLTTLGQVRNYGLSLIPSGDYIYIADDDDYRHPSLLLKMFTHWSSIDPSACMVQITRRLNFNMLTKACWQSVDTRGLVHFLGCIDRLRQKGFKYNHVDSLEDLTIHPLTNRLLYLDNEPWLYVRYTHSSNTSLYVDKFQDRAQLINGAYTERDVTDESWKQYCDLNQPPSA